jgi:hypothetical protein
MATTDVQVINHHQANLNVRERVSAKGKVGYKTHITVEVHSEPITVCLDEAAAAKFVAQAFAKRVSEQTREIGQTVKPATAAARRTLEKAYSAGKPYAVKQFSGGRTGATPPKVGSNQAFNHSGRLADGIVAMLRGKGEGAEWIINYPANRWDLKHWGDAAKMEVAFRKWVDLVPVMKNPAEDLTIRRAAQDMMSEVLHKQEMDAGYQQAKREGEAIVKFIQTAVQVVA